MPIMFIHGDNQVGKRAPEYNVWSSMKKRCLNPNATDFDRYGGRGITICESWIDSYPTFLADMGRRPPGHTLERIDNDGPYTPDNCKWATPTEQANNRRPRSPSATARESAQARCRPGGDRYVEPVPCPVCGTPFQPTKRKERGTIQKYCSIPCYNQVRGHGTNP